jgi:hypothetical protein
LRPDSAGKEPASPVHSPETARSPASKPEDIHLQVDAPLVFRATSSRAALEANNLPLAHAGGLAPLPAAVPPPPLQSANDPPHGLLRKLKSFFAGIFS